MQIKHSNRYLYLMIIILFFSGCASIPAQKEGVIFERQGVSALLIPSEMRDVYFNDPKSLERHCRAPGSDVSIESNSSVSLGVSLSEGSDKITDSDGQAALALGGRNPAVLIARELMYRACELSSNLNADQKTTLFIYERFLQTIEKSVTTQTGDGTSSTDVNSNSISLSDVIEATKKVDSDSDDGGLADGPPT